MRPTTQYAVIVNQQLSRRMRGLLDQLWGGLGTHQLRQSGAAWVLRRVLGGVAKQEVPTARVVKAQPDGEDRTQVLVIDRDRELVELVAYILRRAGIDFLAVHDASSALEAFASRRPRVVVVDPYGLDVLNQLRASRGDTAIIVLTAGEDEDPRTATLGPGADGHLTKPFSCTELMTSIHAYLQRGEPDPPELPRERIRRSSGAFAG